MPSKKIFVFSDSLGLPRNAPEIVKWSETWIQLMKSNYTLEYLSLGGATVDELYRQSSYYKTFESDIVIVQSGIVDCAPRALKESEKRLIKKNRFVDQFFKKYLTKEKLAKWRDKRNIKLTPEKKFKFYIEAFHKLYGDKLFWLGILPACNDYEQSVRGITKNIQLYNQIIELSLGPNFICMNDFPKEGYMTDFHHLNKIGHEYITKKILAYINT